MEDNLEDERPATAIDDKVISMSRRGSALVSQRPCSCNQVLLLNSDQDKVFEEHFNLRCDGAFTEAEAVKKIKKSVELKPDKKCPCKRGYKFFVIDMADMDHKLALEFIMTELKAHFTKLEQN